MPSPASLDYLKSFHHQYEPAEHQRFGHVTTISHEGNMIVFVMEGTRIRYAVLGATDQTPDDADAWPDDLRTLDFPRELQMAGQEAIGNLVMPLTLVDADAVTGVDTIEEVPPGELTPEKAKKLDAFLSTTARLGGDFDFHVVSTDMHVYVFRQSVAGTDPGNIVGQSATVANASHLTTGVTIAGGARGGPRQGLLHHTLLVDRFTLVASGQSMTLQPMRESRYQRSRNKSLPAGRTDTLDQKDMDGKSFFEPTIALTLMPPVGPGGFCVATIPSENGNGRWQFFIHNADAWEVEGFSVARDDKGGFDFQGERFYTSPDPTYRDSVLERRPGQCPFTRLDLVPLVQGALGEPRWVLRTPRTERFFKEQPHDQLTLALPDVDAEGTSGMCIECWIKPESELTLNSAGDNAGGNRKTLPAGVWSHLQANCLLRRAGAGWVLEIRIDVDESDRDPVFLRHIIDEPPRPIDLLARVLALLTADHRLAELRVFNLPRAASRARHDRHHRMSGSEPYLIAYYPLAGGSDLVLHNHAANLRAAGWSFGSYPDARPGMANPEASWVLDSPPVQDAPGVDRRSLASLDAAMVGMSCLLYHEQIAEKPDMSDLARGDVRVMLALTEALAPDAADAPDTPGNVLVLDWNVTPEGRLARARPIAVSALSPLRPVALQATGDALEELRARKADLEARIERLVQTEGVVPVPSTSLDGIGGDGPATLPGAGGGTPAPGAVAGGGALLAHLAEFANQQPTGLPHDALALDLAALGGTMGGREARAVADPPSPASSAGSDATAAEPASIQGQRERLAYYRRELAAVERSLRDLARLETDDLHALDPEYSGPYREAMPVAGTDGLGCTLCAARLGFAAAPHRATLFEAAGGTVLLYFAQRVGSQHEIASATYDVKAVRHVIEHDLETVDGRRGMLSLGSQQSDEAAASTTSRLELVPHATQPDQPELSTLTLTLSNPVLGIEETWSGIPNSVAMLAGVINGQSLPGGCSKVVKLGGEIFVDNLASFHSRLVIARLKLEGLPHVALRGIAAGIDQPGVAPAWSSEPAGYSFAPLQRFVASLKDPGALRKMRGDRALTLESWVFPFTNADDEWDAFERVMWFKDTREDGSTGIFNYGIGLSSRAPERLIPKAGVGFVAYAAGALAGKALALGHDGALYLVKDELVSRATIETLFRFDDALQNWSWFTLQGYFRLELKNGSLVCQEYTGPATRRTVIGPIVRGRWHHLAVVVDDATADVVVDGIHRIRLTSTDSSFGILHFTTGGNRMSLAELRIWHAKRSIADIRAFMDLALNAESLAFDELRVYLPAVGVQDDGYDILEKDARIPNYIHDSDYTIKANALGFSPTPFRTIRYVCDDVKRRSVIGLRQQCWSHVAVRYAHAYGLQLDPELRIEAESDESVVARDLTIEMALTWKGRTAVLLDQALENSEGDADGEHGRGGHAFCLGVDNAGRLLFTYSAMAGSSPTNPVITPWRGTHGFVSTSKLTPGKFQTLAVRRWTRKVRITEYEDGSIYNDKNDFHESHRDEEQVTVDFFIDGVACGSFLVNEPLHLFKREDGQEIPLYPRPGVTAEALAKEAKEAASPPTTMNGKPDRLPFYAPKVDGNALPMVMGERFDGILYEVRLWSVKCEIGPVWSPPRAAMSALVHWWRFEDGRGSRVGDTRDPKTAWIIRMGKEEEAGTWLPSEDVESHYSSLSLNGMPLRTLDDGDAGHLPVDHGFSLGRNFSGLIDEVRIWNSLRSDEAIRDNLFVKLHDDLEDVIAYYPFNLDPAGDVHDEGHAGLDLAVTDTQLAPAAARGRAGRRKARDAWTPDHHSINDGPARSEIGMVRTVLNPFHNRFIRTTDSVVCAQEYADMQMDGAGGVAGAYKRAYAFLDEGDLHLVTGFRVGALTSEWVSQVQYDPQLVGYIEGAPPVPGENLTLGPKTLKMDYNAVSSIELVDAITDKYTYSQSREIAEKTSTEVDATYGNTYGIKDFVIAPFGVGLTFKATANFSGGYKGKYETSNGVVTKNGIVTERESRKTTRFQVNGHWQSAYIDRKLIEDDTASNPEAGYNKTLGLRFLPENKGLALVKSKTADVFALRLRGHRGILAYRMLPSPDIPEDFNLMTFDINPKYTKQGTLDGRLGLDGNEEEGFQAFFDPDYRGSAGRGEYSYFKPREAYRLKSQIDREEAGLAAYYGNFNAKSTGGAPGYASLSDDLPAILAVGGGAAVAGGLAAVGGMASAGVASGVAASAAAIKSAILGTTVAASTATPSILASVAAGMPFVLGPILSATGVGMAAVNMHTMTRFKNAFEATPGSLAVTPSRRNLMNTYVWTASGGLFELNSTQKNTFSQVMTGKFTVQDLHGMQAEGGFGADASGLSLKAAFKMVGMMGSQLAVERSKQNDTSEGFAMKVTLTPPNNIRHYRYLTQQEWNFAFSDPYGKANLPGKVDAYRFSTFFLDGKESHHDDFFEKVVDQKWLSQSSDPNAAALRPLKDRSTKSKPWRILHRVTFVSRILPSVTKADAGPATTVEQAMTASQIQSNYELINLLEPVLGGATNTVRSLTRRLHQELPRFPHLLPFEPEIREMLVLYYGIPEHT